MMNCCTIPHKMFAQKMCVQNLPAHDFQMVVAMATHMAKEPRFDKLSTFHITEVCANYD